MHFFTPPVAQGLIICLFWNFIGGSALLISDGKQVRAAPAVPACCRSIASGWASLLLKQARRVGCAWLAQLRATRFCRRTQQHTAGLPSQSPRPVLLRAPRASGVRLAVELHLVCGRRAGRLHPLVSSCWGTVWRGGEQ